VGFNQNSVLGLFACIALCSSASASDCTKTSTGLIPLNDLGKSLYLGEMGGLYPEGMNRRPAAHEASGLEIAQGIVPLDAAGNPDPNGKVVLLSIGMSNATQEWSAFMSLALQDPDLNSRLVIVDGAEGGRDARDISNPGSTYWSQTIPSRLANAGVTAAQVQVLWLKEAVARPTASFPDDALELQGLLESIVQILKDLFPNSEVTYLNSRSYAGYAGTDLNPEPYAYQQGFAIKWLIEDQISGDPDLNYDPDAGPVEAPWLSFGVYMWADGLVARSDGMTWVCADFRDDGTHPSDQGRRKVAELLLHHFKSDLTSTPWFLETGSGHCGVPAFADLYGTGTSGTNGVPHLITMTLPVIPSADPFGFLIHSARPNSTAFFLVGVTPLADFEVPLEGGSLLVLPILLFPRPTDPAGVATLPLGFLPDDPALCGAIAYVQGLVFDPLGPTGKLAHTQGMEVVAGD